jgi:hypothetical protein
MTNKNLGKKQLEELSKQIKQDQIKDASAEKRVKIKTSFKKAVKKMGQTPPPKKEDK